ncbi:hypothetical protein FHR84_003326 [Actinopolyspora biskrensis]|uniref:Antibiotic biosynthesis monooxygenase n=1 Tax=Actinopolyspora biskrensis TaxID=1470178 RepID=A0A852ZBH6_9ACTN|nr:hypothetical protein [Actinopolyspora biskrensis]NYH79977.1 hypothetical protein [Actinopolyspora biskrensis]
MRAVVVWWDLRYSEQTIDSLGEYLNDGAARRFSGVHGLVLKFWISDRGADRWGAVLLWESADAAAEAAMPSGAAELIGYSPTERYEFDVEAVVEGIHGLAEQGGAAVVP